MIQKFDGANNPLSGAEFKIYRSKTDGSGPSDEVAAIVTEDLSTPAVNDFTSEELTIGETYWLVETKAPYSEKAGKGAVQLLAKPLKFKLTSSGIEAYNKGQGNAVSPNSDKEIVVDGGTFKIKGDVINVHDSRTAELPKAGGHGNLPQFLVGLMILLLGAAFFTMQSVRGRRS
ncbi:SpaA isopeptide-forming pilin-related protein [Corynebacterium sp. CCM 9204]|uniref:SpaA isopeptide-forming pilin-related protein n=1 Tax=Corynebacterium sp. CCM 9204 TaxID=3057616 RepID=UPI0035247F6A